MIWIIEATNLLKRFSDFLGVFDDKNAKIIAKSIGIIVTKVDNNYSSDQEIINSLTEQLLEILREREKSQNINRNEHLVFERIISNGQFEIFSNPKKNIKLNAIQSTRMLSMIDTKLKFIEN